METYLFSDGAKTKSKNLKDKGAYNSCPHECNYCYAYTSKELARQNYSLHVKQSDSDGILGNNK